MGRTGDRKKSKLTKPDRKSKKLQTSRGGGGGFRVPVSLTAIRKNFMRSHLLSRGKDIAGGRHQQEGSRTGKGT